MVRKVVFFTNCNRNLLIFHRRVVKVRIKKVWRHTLKDLTAHRWRNTGLEVQQVLHVVPHAKDFLHIAQLPHHAEVGKKSGNRTENSVFK